MAITIKGASGRNDDVLAGHAAPDLLGNQQGYTAPGSGPESWDADVNRARDTGTASHQRLAPMLDQTDAGQSREMQMGGLGMLRAQAEGTAPSSSAILAQRANQGAVRMAGQNVTAARTAGQGIVAARGGETAFTGPKGALVQNAANASERLGEISRGAGAYAHGAGQIQTQDIAAAQADADLEAQQRQLNEARQQGFERRGWNTRNMESQTYDRWLALNRGDVARMGQERDARNAADAAQNQEYISTGASTLTGGLMATQPSDKRTKMNIGSLSSMSKGRY